MTLFWFIRSVCVRAHMPQRQERLSAAQARSRSVNGAIAFGPQPRKYNIKLNRKVRRLALRSALSEKLADNNMTVVENLTFDEIKTKKAVALLNAFGFDRKTLFVAEEMENFDNAFVSMRNIPNAMLVTVSSLNVYDIVNADKIVFTEAAAVKAGEVFA